MSRKERVLDFFFPPRCAFCGAILEKSGDGVCETCRKALPRTADTERKCDFVRAYTAPFYYEEPVRQGMLAYKFRNAPSRGKVFGRILGEDLLRRGVGDFDLISWVPLSAKRYRRRGYDQAQLLAEQASAQLCRSQLTTLPNSLSSMFDKPTADALEDRSLYTDFTNNIYSIILTLFNLHQKMP